MIDVVAIGITNAGKSATLSALADCRGLFPSRDVPRATRTVSAFEVGRLRLIDTPGLDASELDTRQALATAFEAQRVLFCHSLRMGDLRPTELAALATYRRGGTNVAGPGSRIVDRTWFVLTHADDVANQRVADEIAEAIAGQLRRMFELPFLAPRAPAVEVGPGERPPRRLLFVANRRYWLARRHDGQVREQLLAMSGIPRLLRCLQTEPRRDRARDTGRMTA